ncbi:hypothetical protein CBR_g88544 [Chara braunii]|uniref:Ribosome biogenesis protein NOP53 n=1 Tax=Chara braunii TaxID=69332 RepID=A0A388KB17_CHABU|nr:hypothetical protein CBR_g88544 [Chara braunii]|eukprot:GBG67255.1 hypothetical protein CBR_g88544 [Chara braunii]
MGKAKTSRKGKKEWRKNIGTEEQDAYIEEVAKDARSGGPVHQLKDEQIFFVDKTKAPVLERKIDRARKKVLRCDSILQRNSLIPPVTLGVKKKKKLMTGVATAAAAAVLPGTFSTKSAASKSRSKGNARAADNTVEGSNPTKRKRKGEEQFDLWSDGLRSEDNVIYSAGAEDAEGGGKHEEKEDPGAPGHIPEDEDTKRKRTKKKKNSKPACPAVEVCLPGCSYNPTFNDHQDALGEAVALEMKAIYERDMQPEGIPMKVVDAVEEDYGDLSCLQIGGAAAENGEEGIREEGESSEEGEHGVAAPSRAVKVKKLTRTELNRRARRRAQEMLEKSKKHRKKMRKDIIRLPELVEELKSEADEKERKRIRLQVSRTERKAAGPPRLGKHKFQPAPVQVMLSEELTGSMRTLKGCFTLLRDRYKSLQKRGLVEPRTKLGRKQMKKRKEYEPGSRGRRERLMHAERMAEKALEKAGGGQIIM